MEDTDHGVEPRAGIMDLSWERQQKKTFTAWCNSHLRKVGLHIDEINESFRDGRTLISLLEVISGEKLPKPEKGRMRVHKVNNVQKALDFISSKGVRLAGIGAEEIVDGNLKMTLGMIWTIILRFAIQDISVEEMTAKEGLLLWCQRKTQPYKNVNVQNFHMSFKDGLAFCALIHRHRPELIDYDSLRKDDPLRNLTTAFEVAEKELDIPKMLDPEDMINQVKPDERAVMTYVSAYYHAFASGQQAEMAAKRIGKVLDINKENERLMQEYEDLASELLAWIERMISEQSDRSQENTLEATRGKLQDFRNYRSEEKPPKAEEKGRLETHFNTLQTKLRISNRPAYMPTTGKMIQDIAHAWRNLEKSEKDYEEFLMAEIRRLERLEHLAAKFTHKAAIHESWTAGKDEMLSADDLEDVTLAGVLALKKQHEAFESDLAAHEDRIEQLNAIVQELTSLGYFDADAKNADMQRMSEKWELLRNLSDQRMARLREAEELQMELDRLRLDFAKKAAPFNNWMDGAKEELLDVFSVHSIQEVRDLLDAHSAFKANIEVAQSEYDGLMAVASQLQSMGGGGANPYTSLTPEDVQQKWDEVLTFVPQRDENLQSELVRQERHEELRMEFANLANEVGPWLEQETEYLATLGLQSTGSLEENLELLHQEEAKVSDYKQHMDNLEAASHRVHEELVFDNAHTVYNMDTLRVQYQQLKSAVSRNINAVENQILTRDSMGITEEQLQEFRQSFNHFDKDGSGELDRNEFKACLLSMGQNLGDDDVRLNEFMQKVDPNETGRVTFDSYLNFMTRQATDEDSAEQVLASFKILAGDKPYITTEQLKRELPADQAEYCLSRMSPYTGPGAPEDALDYQSFATALYGQSDL